MKLGELIQEYRQEKDMSQRQFAKACSLSNGYIAMLERGGINPKTKQPMVPTITALKKIANGMGISLSDLFNKADDMQVALLEDDTVESFKKIFTPTEIEGEYVDKLDLEIATLILNLSGKQKQEALSYLRYLAEKANN